MTRKTFVDLFSKQTVSFGDNVDIDYLLHEYEDFGSVSIFHTKLNGLVSELGVLLSDENKQTAKDFIYLELLFYFYIAMIGDKRFLKKDLSLIFLNHNEPLQGVVKQKHIMKKARILMKQKFTAHFYELKSEWYFNDVEEEARLFTLDGDYIEYNATVSSILREELYQEIIKAEHPYRHKPVAYTFPNLEEEKDSHVYDLTNEKGDNFPIVGRTFRKKQLTETHEFPMTKHLEMIKRRKNPYSDLNNHLPTLKTAEYMGENWIKRYEDMNLYHIDHIKNELIETKDFYLDSFTNIVGLLGSGKSTLKFLLIKSLVESGKRIVILEDNVEQSFGMMKELNAIGVHSSVFFGLSNLDGHREQYYKTHAYKEENLLSFVRNNEKELKILDDTSIAYSCFKNNNPDDEKETLKEKSYNFPQFIQVCKKDGESTKRSKRMANPEYTDMGLFKRYYELMDAPVWIGNYDSFLKTQIPYAFDMHQRSFFEAAMLRSDLIIVDESDHAQFKFDNIFIDRLELVAANGKENFEERFLDYLFRKNTEVNKIKDQPFLLHYKRKILYLQEIVHSHMYPLLLKNEFVQNDLSGKNFTIFKLIKSFYEDFFEFDGFIDENPSFKELLMLFYGDTFKHYLRTKEEKEIHNSIQDEFDKVKTCVIENEIEGSKSKANDQKFRQIDAFLSFFLSHLEVDRRKRSFSNDEHFEFSKEMLIRFEFLLVFFEFDEALRYLYYNYSNFIQEADLENEEKFNRNFIKTTVNKLDYIVPETLLSQTFAYHFSLKDSKLQMFYYNGIGREFLNYIHESFEYIEPTHHPALLLLSATSFAPESSYYHNRFNPQWLIKNKNQTKMNINTYFLPCYKEEKTQRKPISLAGLSGAKKQDSIFEMIQYLLKNKVFDRLLSELETEFELHGNKEQGKRRIISIVTSSFENAEIVYDKLKYTDYKVKVLHSDEKYKMGELITFKDYHVKKTNVHLLYQEEVDIFIFVRDSIGRGYNILQGSKSRDSLIGKMLFLNRPYPIPDDFNDVIHMIHSLYPTFIEQVEEHAKTSPIENHKYWGQLVGKSIFQFNKWISKDIRWNRLNEKDKEVISFNMLVKIYQTIGRGIRNGTPLDVYFLDGSFYSFKDEETESSDMNYKDMLAVWTKMLNANGHILVKELYGPLIEALGKLEVLD